MQFLSVFPAHGTDSNSLKLHRGRHSESKKKKKICQVKLTLFTIQTGFFYSSGTGRGGLIWSPPLNSENIKAMTTKRGGQIIRPKRFPLRCATKSGDLI